MKEGSHNGAVVSSKDQGSTFALFLLFFISSLPYIFAFYYIIIFCYFVILLFYFLIMIIAQVQSISVINKVRVYVGLPSSKVTTFELRF